MEMLVLYTQFRNEGAGLLFRVAARRKHALAYQVGSLRNGLASVCEQEIVTDITRYPKANTENKDKNKAKL
jgi:hypothetical protein